MKIEDIINSTEEIEPETLKKLFPYLTELDRETIYVLKLIKNTNLIFEDMDIFENAVQVLNGVSPNVETTEGTSPEFIWKALETMYRLRPDMKLSKEVKEYIKFIYNDNGYKFYPPLSGIDNPLLSAVIEKSIKGPFPLQENFLDIQAFKYLKIQQYLKKGK